MPLFGSKLKNLDNPLRVLAKKLDALEEFRIQREQLMTKFEEQEERVERFKKDYEERQV